LDSEQTAGQFRALPLRMVRPAALRAIALPWAHFFTAAVFAMTLCPRRFDVLVLEFLLLGQLRSGDRHFRYVWHAIREHQLAAALAEDHAASRHLFIVLTFRFHQSPVS
jgi:hypothetical protein